MNATFATLEEAWGPAGQLATLPPNPYQNTSYQRQVIENGMSTGIAPREPQALDAMTVKLYLKKLFEESGPVAVSALLPAKYMSQTLPAIPRPKGKGKCFMDNWGAFWDTIMDPENVGVLLIAAFALLVITDYIKV